MKKEGLILFLTALTVGATALGAQEPVEGLVFSGSVITGLRYRSFGSMGGGYNVFDIDAGDDYLVEGDTASLRAALNKGFYGATFALSLNANNSYAGFWTVGDLYVSEATAWAKLLNDKLQAKVGYYGDFDYFSPVNAWSLAGAGGASNALQMTVYPMPGLQIDVRTKNLSNLNHASHPQFMGFQNNWYNGEEYLRNIDAGLRYVNPNFTAFVAFDDSSTASTAGTPEVLGSDGVTVVEPAVSGDAVTQADVYGYFAWTGVPKLSVGVESKFLDLTSERKNFGGDAIGITNVTALNANYQFTGALSARLWLIAGAASDGLDGASELLADDGGFTFTADAEAAYKLNDALTFSLRPIFNVPNTKNFDVFNISVRPKVAWTLAAIPYAATINFWYKLRVYGEKTTSYANNDHEALNHTVALTFNWSF
jgi:hypothetical protein